MENGYYKELRRKILHLIQRLDDEAIPFYKYIKMSQSQFYVLLTKIKTQIINKTLCYEKLEAP